ncbi:MAG: hypothetical protein GY938_10130, partial [Ketobacter sp.]|nr:hypothetical protein [Ketobacter sp.]
MSCMLTFSYRTIVTTGTTSDYTTVVNRRGYPGSSRVTIITCAGTRNVSCMFTFGYRATVTTGTDPDYSTVVIRRRSPGRSRVAM